MDSAGTTTHKGTERHHGVIYTRLYWILTYLRGQIPNIHLRILLARWLLTFAPRYTFNELRTSVLRVIGFEIGRKSKFLGTPKILGRDNLYKRLKIGHGCWINFDCHFELSAPIVIGDGVGIGPEVMIMTGTHEIGPESYRVGKLIALPVTIEDGVWIGARCTILPGVTIGRGSVISAGSIVRHSVPPNTIVVGTQGVPIEKWMALRQQGDW